MHLSLIGAAGSKPAVDVFDDFLCREMHILIDI